MGAAAERRASDIDAAVLDWLLAGDVAIQYQARRDLCGEDNRHLQARIAGEGWGAAFLRCRHSDGSWGRGFYQPKWTSSFYTLLDLRTLELAPDHPLVRDSIARILATEKRADGGIGPGRTIAVSDVCANGMFLNVAAYFGAPQAELRSIVDFLLGQPMPDGGFNCESNRRHPRHSSLHTTLSVLEGLLGFRAAGHGYRHAEIAAAERAGREFMLLHRLFRSDHTGAVIRPEFLRFPFPPRWHYNILRALDYFRAAGQPWESRMEEALAVVRARRRGDGRWLLNAPHPGAAHFEMEHPGQPSRWISLIALRVLRTYGGEGG